MIFKIIKTFCLSRKFHRFLSLYSFFTKPIYRRNYAFDCNTLWLYQSWPIVCITFYIWELVKFIYSILQATLFLILYYRVSNIEVCDLKVFKNIESLIGLNYSEKIFKQILKKQLDIFYYFLVFAKEFFFPCL